MAEIEGNGFRPTPSTAHVLYEAFISCVLRSNARSAARPHDHRVAQAALGHQLLDVRHLDRHERRQVLVAVLGDQDHVLEPMPRCSSSIRNCGSIVKMRPGSSVVGLQSADIVHLEADVVAEPARLCCGAVALDELRRRGLDALVGERDTTP